MVADLDRDHSMPRRLTLTLTVIDGAMLLYWGTSALAALRIIALPGSAMYAGYGTPLMDAWNWSFAPLDILFSLLGLISVRRASQGRADWRVYAIMSLSLTFCAGLMAISFWALTGFFDLSWWIPNLALMLVPAYWLARMARA